MDQHISSSYGIKTQLSLASLMFFGPFIKHFLTENDDFELEEKDKTFVKGYMILGSINLGLAAICILLGSASKFISHTSLDILFLIFSSILLFLLLAGSIAVFANISLKKTTNTDLTESISKDLSSNNNVIRDYIPFMNLYLWYSAHDFDGEHSIIKESLVIWTLFGILCFSGNVWIIGILLIAIVMRIVTLTVIGDGLSNNWHTTIDRLFYKNTEEIWGWISGWLLGHIWNIFGAKIVIGDKQKEQQSYYSYLYDLKKYGNIQRQYILLFIATSYILYITSSREGFGLIIFGTALIWGRYIMMALIWYHLPPLPLIHDLFRGVTILFEKKIPINKK